MVNIPDELYSKIKEAMPICCVDLLLYKNNAVLLCKRNNAPAKGEWWILGGRVFKGETLVEAAKRKGKEELGLDVKIVEYVGTYDNIFPEVHTVSTVFLAQPLSNNIMLDSQHSEYCWFQWDLLPDIQPMLMKELRDGRALIRGH